MKDFEFLKCIGDGGFGKVYLAKHTTTGQAFAMKSMLWSKIQQNAWKEDQAEIEKDIGQLVNHPFLAGIEYVFTTEKKLFFCLPLVRGGDLFTNLYDSRINRA